MVIVLGTGGSADNTVVSLDCIVCNGRRTVLNGDFERKVAVDITVAV